jgi:hypothetical protein
MANPTPARQTGALLLLLAAELCDPNARALADAGKPSRTYEIARALENLIAVLADRELA